MAAEQDDLIDYSSDDEQVKPTTLKPTPAAGAASATKGTKETNLKVIHISL